MGSAENDKKDEKDPEDGGGSGNANVAVNQVEKEDNNQDKDANSGGASGGGKADPDNKPETDPQLTSPAAPSPANNEYENLNIPLPGKDVKGPPQNKDDDDDNDSVDDVLAGLQEDDLFHGMLPEEDLNNFLKEDGDYILHTTANAKGKMVGVGVQHLGQKKFFPVSMTDGKASFDNIHMKRTLLELVKYHNEHSIAVAKIDGKSVMLVRPILRETWELKYDDITLGDKLGEGAFGEVRKGVLQQKNLRCVTVAIKVIKGDVSKAAIETAMKEARIMRRYNHPNVVKFHGVQAVQDPFMIIMEFVKGGALSDYLKKNTKNITNEQRALMCLDAALGLEYLHMQDCIHRDIAARNCLMDVVSKKLKLSDFGLSSIGTIQCLDPSKPAPIRWLAPEVVKTAMFGKPADVWSFGVLCWEIYSDAEVPYKEYSMGEVQTRIRQDDGFRLRMPLTCNCKLRALITECWIGDPNKRPTMVALVKGMDQMVDKKQKYMEGEKKDKKKKSKSRPPQPGGGKKIRVPSKMQPVEDKEAGGKDKKGQDRRRDRDERDRKRDDRDDRRKDRDDKERKRDKDRERDEDRDSDSNENKSRTSKPKDKKSRTSQAKRRAKAPPAPSTGKRRSIREERDKEDDEEMVKSKDRKRKSKRTAKARTSQSREQKQQDSDDTDYKDRKNKSKGSGAKPVRRKGSRDVVNNKESDSDENLKSGAKKKARPGKSKNASNERRKVSQEQRDDGPRTDKKKKKRN